MLSCIVEMEDINVTDKERQVFDRLIQVVNHCNLGIQLWVAGGWVRDKLLGKECCDIDISLDYMLGRDFCKKMNDYLISKGEKPQKFEVIKCKPDQCKYVETARTRVFDVWVDFVNLRSEDYTEYIRIPTIEFGPEAKDAYRRDLTINSLYYNIKTCSVEDFTGRGLDDLKTGKIMTPLPPKEMFLDDPLRVLRAIRFSARFNFKMVKELKVAAADSDVNSAFSSKISRERIGHEIDHMVSGNQPVKAITNIYESGLFWNVFTLPPNVEPLVPKEHDRICVGSMDVAWRLMHGVGVSTFSDEQRRLYLYGALFLPLRKSVYLDNKNEIGSSVNHIFKNSLKVKVGNVIKLHDLLENFSSLIPFMVSSESMKHVEVDWKSDMIDVPVPLKLRILLGLVLKEIKDLWRVTLMLSIVLMKDSCVESVGNEIEVFRKVEEGILKLGLEKVWEVKPLLGGRDILQILELRNMGQRVGRWKKKLRQWQLAYPCGNVQEFVDWMMMQRKLKHLTT
ncbi:putative CCA tRNA nucleotidyltransferase 2 isoform X1 [Tanacetum coccineum]|uniref:CCA tRNA nucleotidyltransferase 2 isoform X1 n=1 Tax=Tanacetum coccineum TaxID=301880 RepID=A0ABQ5GA51_9ASTR